MSGWFLDGFFAIRLEIAYKIPTGPLDQAYSDLAEFEILRQPSKFTGNSCPSASRYSEILIKVLNKPKGKPRV